MVEKEEEKWNRKKQTLIDEISDKMINGDLLTKIQAAREIRSMIRNRNSSVKLRVKFAAAGVIQPLVLLLCSSHHDAREASLLALLNLASRNDRSKNKPGSATGNSGHIGVPGTYGPYGTSPAGYNLNPAATAGNSTFNEDLGGSQFKESNVYVTGQQSEGPGVWIAGRDIGGSFYNLPQGGQVAYTPTQGGHGTFASIYHHPPQPVTTGAVHPLLQQSQTGVDMVGPTSTMYQQQQQQQPPHPHPHPQPAQINWPNNY